MSGGPCRQGEASGDISKSRTVTGGFGNGINAMNARKEYSDILEKRLSGNASGVRRYAVQIRAAVAELAARVMTRSIELGVSLLMLSTLAFPLLLALGIRKLATSKPVLMRQVIAGARSFPVNIYRFNDIRAPFRDLPLFIGVLAGKLALVGGSIRAFEERSPSPESGYTGMMKPGIVSLWDLRRSSKTAHEGREAIEWEYTFSKGAAYDLLLLLRALPMLFYTESVSDVDGIFRILDLDIDNLTMDEAIAVIAARIEGKKQARIFFVNPDCLNKSVSDREYFELLKSGDCLFPDGIGLIIAGKMLNTPLKENINGTDMLPFLCRMAAARGERLFLLGGKPGVAEMAAMKLREHYGVSIAGTAHGYFNHETESRSVVDRINESGASILLVAFGTPIQEKWISRHHDVLAPLVLMGVGGLFDFYSGNISRAPRWLREIGLEWVYRILQEPGRMWKRYVIGNPLFLFRVMKWKILRQRTISIGHGT
ncbi:MAG: WecB/TagA/CpsF family glycosyltransferase [Chlorobiaceae bacterium]|nr:WecB/TagA/CpsF family glycosyltransferase [Chlorobiaceae bacterium]NTW74077.1 WecB/TagA/CpsF family glycosyltransferase [Chlorobiaceae bacterium]